MSHIIQSLWIGDSLSKSEQLCVKSFVDNGHEFHLYIYGDVKNIPEGVIVKDGNEIVDDDGEIITDRDGYRKTNRGTKGVKTMSLRDKDEIVSVRQIPDLEDQLFILTKTGMMIRLAAAQTKETRGKVTKGTRIMELRNADKTGHVDEIIFVARLPAELLEDDKTLESDEEEE